jgi:hypothetical protein
MKTSKIPYTWCMLVWLYILTVVCYLYITSSISYVGMFMVCLLTTLKMPSYGGSLVMAKKQTDRGNSSTTWIMLFYFPQKYYFNINCLLPRGLLRWIICRLWSKRLWCHGRPRGPCYRPVVWLGTKVGWWRFRESRWNHDTPYRIVCCVVFQYHYVLFSVCSRSTTDHIFFIRQILEKKWEYNEAVHQLFIDLKKVYDSVRREVLYNILIEFGIPMKLVRLIEMCMNETCSRVRVGKHLFDILIQRGYTY